MCRGRSCLWKYKDGATSGDAGITAYNRLRDVTGQFHADNFVTTPADVPMNPGVDMPEVTFEASFDDGRGARCRDSDRFCG